MSIYDIAKDISEGLARVACVGEVNGEVKDLRTVIDSDCELNILTFDSDAGKHAYRHTCSHVLAEAVLNLYPEAKLAIGPSIDTGFYYDFDMPPLTREDLEGFSVRVLEPVRSTYRGYELISSPPPSSGGTHVAQILNVLECFDVGRMEVNSAEYLHLFSEVFKRCYADRAKYMGDPNFVSVPLRGLLSKAYARELAGQIDLARAQPPCFGQPGKHESTSTTHFSIGDREGNLVAVTRTINHFFGSCVVPEGLGFLLISPSIPIPPTRRQGARCPSAA